jgi:8-oxo-dGTP pyrophosphatase MutT (NUDIX family)
MRTDESTFDKRLRADHRGASLIIPHRGGLLWAISTPNFWRRIGERFYVYYQGIGGGVEQGETFLRAAIREGEEELGLRPDLISPRKTFFVDGIRRTVTMVGPDDRPSPLFVHRQKINRGEILVVFNYLACLSKEPKPSSEVPALLSMPIERLMKDRTETISQYLRDGCRISEQVPIRRGALLRPWGTPIYLLKLLKDGLLSSDTGEW